MLQWMGGSRRKVNTSRKSTHNRQKQYFEQKRRQQQQTSGFDSHLDAENVCGQYSEMSKSLDILTFQNLATGAQECKSSLTNAEESAEINALPVKCHFSNCSPRLVTTEVSKHAASQKEARTNTSDYKVASPKIAGIIFTTKDISNSPVKTHRCSSRKNDEKFDNQKTETECHISVLDLLGDDGINENSQGSPVHEAHVAFSIEGLGKMGMGTPVRSPQQPGRRFFNELSPKPVKRYQSFKNVNHMDDLKIELNAMIHDMDMPSSENRPRPINSKSINDYSNLSKNEQSMAEGRTPLYSQFRERDNFFSEETSFIDIENERLWKDPCSISAGHGILDENFPDESTHDADWRTPAYNMDCNSADLLTDETDDESDFTFEDSSWSNKREVAEALRDFHILEPESPSSCLKHRASGKDHDFIHLDAKRYSGGKERWDYSQPVWSSFADDDDEKDNISLLSESSATSNTVEGGKSKSVLGKSPRKYESELWRDHVKVYSKKDLYAEEAVYGNRDSKHRVKNLNVTGHHRRVLNSPRNKLFDECVDPRRSKDSDSHYRWLFEEEFTPVDINLCFDSFQRTSADAGCKYSSEVLFDAFPSSSPYLNTHTSCKKTKIDSPVKYSPFGGSLFTEKILSPQAFSPMQCFDSPSFLDIGLKSRKPAISQASRMHAEPPHSYHASGCQEDVECPGLSGQEQIHEDGKERSEIQSNGYGGSPDALERDISVGNNDLSGKTVDDPCSRANSKGKGTENGTPENCDQPITMDCSEHVDEISSAMKEVPNEPESCLSDKHLFDGILSSQNCNEGTVEIEEESDFQEIDTTFKENDSKETSYKVMLESYVLQLLCVQKVLKEETQQNSVKKV
ncbi:hypothetical protein ACHQM5_020671 [Ranunculus cassubicifolius]